MNGFDEYYAEHYWTQRAIKEAVMERFHYESEEDFSFDLENPQVWTIWTVKDREQTGSHVGSSKSLMSFSTEKRLRSLRTTSTPHSTTLRSAWGNLGTP